MSRPRAIGVRLLQQFDSGKMPRPTKSIDDWKCPFCKEHHPFESDTAGACDVSELSGFVEEVICPSCGKTSSVSLSIEFRAEPVVE